LLRPLARRSSLICVAAPPLQPHPGAQAAGHLARAVQAAGRAKGSILWLLRKQKGDANVRHNQPARAARAGWLAGRQTSARSPNPVIDEISLHLISRVNLLN